MRLTLLSIVLLLAFGCNQAQPPFTEVPAVGAETGQLDSFFVNSKGDTLRRIFKTDEEWKAELSEKEYHILRQAGTERAFTGDLLDNKARGNYVCAGCGLPLFSSSAKFESGSGWPSYFMPFDPAHVLERPDNSYGWNRIELLCARCGGHLGHVFDDGPKPTGLRYCINAASLDFEKER